MSKIAAFTDTVEDEIIDDSNIETVVNQFLEASNDAVKAGRSKQRAWLFASNDQKVIDDMNEWIVTGCDIINEDVAAKDKVFISRCRKVAIAGAVIGVAVFGYKRWKARKAKKLQNEEAEDKLRHASIKAKNVQNEEAEDDE